MPRPAGDPAGNNRLLAHDESRRPDAQVLSAWTGDFAELHGLTDYRCDDADACDELFSNCHKAFVVGRYLGQRDTHAQLVRYVRDWAT